MDSISTETSTLSSLSIDLAQQAQARLAEPHALDNEETVHFIRVLTKQLRAAWRMAVETAGKDLVKERRRALRGLSGHLSGSRDQSVLIRLCGDLALRQQDPAIAAALTRLAETIRLTPVESAIQPCPAASPAEISSELEREKAAWAALDWSDHAATRRGLRRQIRNSGRRAANAAAEATRNPCAHFWHEWRKSVKQLRYQREFLAVIQGRRPGKRDQRISLLGTRLGERNDLANLARHAESMNSLSGQEHNLIRQAIGRAEAALCRNCRRLGRRYL